jgi:hypothetical protein
MLDEAAAAEAAAAAGERVHGVSALAFAASISLAAERYTSIER